jgi:hypothetical protein
VGVVTAFSVQDTQVVKFGVLGVPFQRPKIFYNFFLEYYAPDLSRIVTHKLLKCSVTPQNKILAAPLSIGRVTRRDKNKIASILLRFFHDFTECFPLG